MDAPLIAKVEAAWQGYTTPQRMNLSYAIENADIISSSRHRPLLPGIFDGTHDHGEPPLRPCITLTRVRVPNLDAVGDALGDELRVAGCTQEDVKYEMRRLANNGNLGWPHFVTAIFNLCVEKRDHVRKYRRDLCRIGALVDNFDVNEDGFLSRDEFRELVLRNVDFEHKVDSDAIDAIFRMLDEDENLGLSTVEIGMFFSYFDKFKALIEGGGGEESSTQIANDMRAADAEGADRQQQLKQSVPVTTRPDQLFIEEL